MIGLAFQHLPLVSRVEVAQRRTPRTAAVNVSSRGTSAQQLCERSSEQAYNSSTQQTDSAAPAAPFTEPPPSRPTCKAKLPQKSKARRVPWSVQHTKVLRAIRDRGLIEPGSKVLVAVSGGQVSYHTALLCPPMPSYAHLCPPMPSYARYCCWHMELMPIARINWHASLQQLERVMSSCL
jgi:hypothetical protein